MSGHVKYAGFTKLQRDWVHERDETRCQMPILVIGKNGERYWSRCGYDKKVNLHVHHLVPRRWASTWIHGGWNVNQSSNAIVLCAKHHVGRGLKGQELLLNSLHPDIEVARIQHAAGETDAFGTMFNRRKQLCDNGQPYWNTLWDFLLQRIANERTEAFKKPWPEKRKGKEEYATDWFEDMVKAYWFEAFDVEEVMK
jgi:hypothetical protein